MTWGVTGYKPEEAWTPCLLQACSGVSSFKRITCGMQLPSSFFRVDNSALKRVVHRHALQI
jgi:hypothetical protein